jgi:hypothetical protein
MHNHDIEEVCKLRLSNTMEDTIAWHYERSGLFSVRNACRLALKIDQEEERVVGSSSRPDGSRRLYNEIWAAQVPPKVGVFAWRLSQKGLSTQCNRRCQKLTEDATCQICGAREESGHHALIQCTKERALREVKHKR